MTTTKEAAGLEHAILRAEEWAGTMPAKEAVKLRPADWHAVCKLGREAAQEIRTLLAQVEELRRERDEVGRALRDEVTARLDAEARATKAEAGIAEAVKALEPFAAEAAQWADTVSPYYAPPQPEPGREKALPGSEAKFSVSDLRAARAFVEKHKESGT